MTAPLIVILVIMLAEKIELIWMQCQILDAGSSPTSYNLLEFRKKFRAITELAIQIYIGNVN